MKRIAAALMLVASTSAHSQNLNTADPIPGAVQSAAPVYDPVEIQPADIPSIGKAETPTFLGDDATAYVDLGFTFSYFGQDFTKAWISSNGFVSFQSSANLCCNGQPLENAQRNTIYQYWTDLISWSGSPYYSKKVLDDGTNGFLVGWYGTYEYGTNRPHSFEMTLSDGGKITFNYLETFDMNGHIITAGLTGPTATDNILLFRGSDTSILSERAFGFNFETGTVTTVDCTITPSDPSCPTQPIDIPGVPTGAPDVTPDTTTIVQQVEETLAQETTTTEVASVESEQQTATAVEQAVAAEQQAVAQVVEQVAAAAEQQATTEQQVAVASEQQTVSTTAASTSSAKETSTKSASVERLNPSQLASLNSGGLGSSEISQASQALSPTDSQQSGDASAKSSMQLFTNASNSSIAMAEAEQQQQLQSSIDSSTTGFGQSSTSSNEVQLVEASTAVAEVAIVASNDVKMSPTVQTAVNEDDVKVVNASQPSNFSNEVKLDTIVQQVAVNDVKTDTQELFTSSIGNTEDIKVASVDLNTSTVASDIKSDTSIQTLLTTETEDSYKAEATTQVAIAETKSEVTTYQEQQKVASNTDNTTRDSSNFMQQVLQPEQVMAIDTSQQSNTSFTQQAEEEKPVVIVQEVQQSSVASAEGRWQESLASQAAALEALNTIGSQSTNGETQESPSSLGEGQGEVISQMAYVAGFSAYKLVSLPDRPEFYKPRRIYRNNRPVDAYMSIFKMTAANDSLWKQMVESQYE
jgi:hypothetical protein